MLYRKYRPQTFDQVVGQQHVVQTLKGALTSGRVGHAYLFCGPRGTGKTTLARLLAKSLNCEARKKDGDCDNLCSFCSVVNENRSLDLIEIDAASNRGIDEIRSLKESALVAAPGGKYKIFVVDECLTEEHLITMSDGTFKKISQINDGDFISSVDLNTGELVNKRVNNFFKRVTDELIEIRSSQGIIRCTPKHKMWVLRNGIFTLTVAQEINKNDYLISPLVLPHIGQNFLTSEQLALLAIIQCDGHISKDSSTIQIEIKKDVSYFINKVRNGLEAWNIKSLLTVKKTKRGTTLLRIYSEELKKKFVELGCPSGKKSQSIDIPDVVFQAPLSSIKSYIDACFCCEGDASFTKSTRLFKLSFNCVSEVFSRKLQLLLKKYGIGSSFKILRRIKNNHSDVYRVDITGYDLRLFQEMIGLSMGRKSRAIKQQLLRKLKTDTMPFQSILLGLHKKLSISHRIMNSAGIFLDGTQNLTRTSFESFISLSKLKELDKFLEFRYEKIISINKKAEKSTVYDFTVDDTHTFIANGICSSNCHMLTKDAFNALLKILEEPPAHVVFVLATTEPHKILPTVLSRVQRFDFKRLTPKEIGGKLRDMAKSEGVSIDPEGLVAIAMSSDGALRDAEVALSKVIASHDPAPILSADRHPPAGGRGRDWGGAGPKKQISVDEVNNSLGLIPLSYYPKFLGYLAVGDKSSALDFVNKAYSAGIDVNQFASGFVEYLRKILMHTINPAVLVSVGEELLDQDLKLVSTYSQALTQQQLIRMINVFVSAKEGIKSSPIPQLPLELAILELSGV